LKEIKKYFLVEPKKMFHYDHLSIATNYSLRTSGLEFDASDVA